MPYPIISRPVMSEGVIDIFAPMSRPGLVGEARGAVPYNVTNVILTQTWMDHSVSSLYRSCIPDIDPSLLQNPITSTRNPRSERVLRRVCILFL